MTGLAGIDLECLHQIIDLMAKGDGSAEVREITGLAPGITIQQFVALWALLKPVSVAPPVPVEQFDINTGITVKRRRISASGRTSKPAHKDWRETAAAGMLPSERVLAHLRTMTAPATSTAIAEATGLSRVQTSNSLQRLRLLKQATIAKPTGQNNEAVWALAVMP